MNESTKRRALIAASKVTLSTLIAGAGAGAALLGAIACGDDESAVALNERNGTEPTTEQGGSAQTGEGSRPATPPQAPPVTAPPKAPPAAAAACVDVTCCTALVGPLLSEEDAWVWEEEKVAAVRTKLGPDGLACCRVLVEVTNERFDGWRSEDHWACCSALTNDVNDAVASACTPWGPPTPPAFDDALAAPGVHA